VTAELHGLGLPPEVLEKHVGWDPGAAFVAKGLARALRAPLHLGSWSRLVVDLNRSPDHARVIPRTLSGRRVRANELDEAGHAERLRRYWRPYRTAVERSVRERIARAGACLHLSIHSFVERLYGRERLLDFGLLYEPARPRERAFIDGLFPLLEEQGFAVRRNRPYFGNTDAFVTFLRTQHPPPAYLGIEIEMNQRISRKPAGQRRLLQALRNAVLAQVQG
jgi:predicted N-formylglutamate amidohydrolase